MRKLTDSAAGLLLYAVTLAAELPAAWARLYVAYGVVWLYSESRGAAAAYRWPVAYAVAFAPLAWSLLALVWPAPSAWLWRHRAGGRAPSQRERLAYESALGELGGAAGPRRWFVVDDPEAGAAVCGDALMLTRGMLDERSLVAVLAHELGHLATLDARLAAALDALVLRAPREDGPRRGAIRRAVAALARGGVGLRLTAPAWAAWWREREYRADAYAAALGKGGELASYLELHTLLHDRPIPFMWLSERMHPPTAHRIDRLQQADEAVPR
jgi:Zn-dependent protease with chaperone function